MVPPHKPHIFRKPAKPSLFHSTGLPCRDKEIFKLLNLCDEELQQIFLLLDFKTQCRFRRLCRRWNRLLQSDTVLQTTCFDIPGKVWISIETITTECFRVCFAKTLPRIQTCVFRRGASADAPKETWSWQYLDQRSYVRNILIASINSRFSDCTFRHLVYVGISTGVGAILGDLIPKSVERVTFIRLQLSLSPRTWLCPRYYTTVLEEYLLDVSSYRDYPAIVVAGPYSFEPPHASAEGMLRYVFGDPTTVPDMESIWREFWQSNVPCWLNEDDRRYVYEYIAWTYEDPEKRQQDVRTFLRSLLDTYQPEWRPADGEDLASTCCAHFNVIIRRKLQAELIQMALQWKKPQDVSRETL